MIVPVLRLTRWEWFKLRKRWMPWILVFVAVAIAQATLWGMFYSYNDRPSVEEQTTFYLPGPVDSAGNSTAIPVSCIDIWEGTADAKVEQSDEKLREDALKTVEFLREVVCQDQIEEEARFRDNTRQSFVLPNSLSNGLAVAHSIGAVLIMILAASVLGTEYGWGTLRATLARGVNRWQFLGSKALSLLLMGAMGLIIVALTVAVSSLIAASLLVDDGGLTDSGEWSTAAVMFGKAVYGLMPYAVLALFLSVLTSSSSMGIAFSLAYFFVESILVQILDELFEWFGNVTDFLLGPSVTSWMTETGIRTTGQGSMFPVSHPSSQLHAFLVITAYIIIIGVAAFWLFQRKDIAGARGE